MCGSSGLLFELKDANCLKMDADDLFLAYVSKVSSTLRSEIMRRRTTFEVGALPRHARTWEECKVVLDEVVRESKNLQAF